MSNKSKKGFTIIEVVLVLAIAGLIFLMVFIALPALQRSQRNTQRADDLSRLLTAVNSYQSNNKGKLPFRKEGTDAKYIDKKFIPRYVDSECETSDGKSYTKCGDQFTDPDGVIYKIDYMGDQTAGGDIPAAKFSAGDKGFDHEFIVYTNATCGDEAKWLKGTGNRQVAIFMIMEGGATSCNDNH